MRPATQGAPDTGGRINPSARNKIPPIGGGAGTPTSINTPVKSATLGDNSTGDDGYVLLTFSVSTGSVCMPKTHTPPHRETTSIVSYVYGFFCVITACHDHSRVVPDQC